MARGSAPIIRGLIYEYLRINTQGSYGTYLANARYPSAYIDDEMYSADIEIAQLMVKNSQDHLLTELQTSTSVAIGALIPNNWAVIKVERGGAKLTELTEDEYRTISEAGIFDTTTYSAYYMIVDGRVYVLAGTTVEVTYIDLSRTGSIETPSGFEEAVAMLAAARALMNRNDNPAQSQFLLSQFALFMTGYGIPVDAPLKKTNAQELIED